MNKKFPSLSITIEGAQLTKLKEIQAKTGWTISQIIRYMIDSTDLIEHSIKWKINAEREEK